jgi:predicted nucleic acid-binding protein
MNTVVCDSNFLEALFDPRDVWHSQAKEIELALAPTLPRLFLDVAMTEALGVIARRCQEQKRQALFPQILDKVLNFLPPARLTWLFPLIREYYEESIDLLRNYSGRLNMNDCLIALFMKRNNRSYLLSFDTDFDEVPEIRRITSPADASAIQIE